MVIAADATRAPRDVFDHALQRGGAILGETTAGARDKTSRSDEMTQKTNSKTSEQGRAGIPELGDVPIAAPPAAIYSGMGSSGL